MVKLISSAVGGFLLILPLASTRILSLFFLIPGLKHLFAFAIQGWIINKMRQGKFVFMSNSGGFSGFGDLRAKESEFVDAIDVESVDLSEQKILSEKSTKN